MSSTLFGRFCDDVGGFVVDTKMGRAWRGLFDTIAMQGLPVATGLALKRIVQAAVANMCAGIRYEVMARDRYHSALAHSY